MSNISYTYATKETPIVKAVVNGNNPWIPLKLVPRLDGSSKVKVIDVSHEGGYSGASVCVKVDNLESFITALRQVAAKGDFK